MKNYLKNNFFFLINKEEKDYIRNKVMNADHLVFQIVIGLIAVLEAIMLAFSFMNSDSIVNMDLEIASRVLYICLIAICVICIVALQVFIRIKKPFLYFVFIAIFTFSIMLWGVVMSIIISFDQFTILYYVLTIIAASALICLEPWVESLCLVLSTVIYFILYYSLDGIQRVNNSVFISGILLAFVISFICFFFNFYRRTKAISLELQITKLNEVLDDKANSDKLTGINNRLFLSEKLENMKHEDFTDGGIMMFDLDYFKNVNDTFGHMAGDKCLSELGKIIKKLFNDKEGFSVRYGGEEFLIYIKNTNKDELFSTAEYLRKTVERNKVVISETETIKYTISIGLALGKGKYSFEQMIDESDKALYKAKETRNCVKYLD